MTQKKQKLTKKQRGFVNDYVDTENGTQAVMKNYNVKDNIVAKSVASENLAKPYIMEAIEVKRRSLKEALIARGITEDYLASKVDVLLSATDLTGKSDYTAIDKGLKHATSIYGIDQDKPKQETGNTYNFIFSPDVQSEVREIEEKIKAKLLKRNENTQTN